MEFKNIKRLDGFKDNYPLILVGELGDYNEPKICDRDRLSKIQDFLTPINSINVEIIKVRMDETLDVTYSTEEPIRYISYDENIFTMEGSVIVPKYPGTCGLYLRLVSYEGLGLFKYKIVTIYPVPLNPPKLYQNELYKNTIYWDRVDGAVKYNIYRFIDWKFELIDSTDDLTYLLNSGTYRIKIVGVDKYNYEGIYSNEINIMVP